MISKALYDSSLMPWASKEERHFAQIENLYSTVVGRYDRGKDPYILVYFRMDQFENIY